jgi:hypothetical protein
VKRLKVHLHDEEESEIIIKSADALKTLTRLMAEHALAQVDVMAASVA